MNPCSSRRRIGSGLTWVTSPTSPMSTSSPDGSAVRPPAGPDQRAVLAREAHRLAAVVVDQPDDLLVDPADEDHLDDLHRLLVGDAHAADEPRLLAEALHHRPDLGPAAVHDHRVHADVLEEDDVAGEPLGQLGRLHRVAAVLDDEGLPPERPDVGQGVHEGAGLLDQLLHGVRHGLSVASRHRMYRLRSSSPMISARRACTKPASTVTVLPARSGAWKETSSSTRSRMV